MKNISPLLRLLLILLFLRAWRRLPTSYHRLSDSVNDVVSAIPLITAAAKSRHGAFFGIFPSVEPPSALVYIEDEEKKAKREQERHTGDFQR